MSFDEYIESCRKIVDKLGKYDEYYDFISKISCVIPFEDQTKTYIDEIIEITVSTTSLAMVIKKLNNDNPVVCVYFDGGPYRVHGEMWELEDHILNILNSNEYL